MFIIKFTEAVLLLFIESVISKTRPLTTSHDEGDNSELTLFRA